MKLFLSLFVLFFSQLGLALESPGNAGVIKESEIQNYTVKIIFIASTEEGETVGSCTASFITPKTLLTAAHCVSELRGDPALAIVNYQDGDADELLVTAPGDFATEIYPNFREVEAEDFSAAAAYDLALVHLKKPIELKSIAKVYTGEKTTPLYLAHDSQFFAVGAGSKSYFAFNPLHKLYNLYDALVGHLKGVWVTVREMGPIIDYTLPRGYKICIGDSGGPLFVYSKSRRQLEILGVHSRGTLDKKFFQSGYCGRNIRATGITPEARGWLKRQIEKYRDY